MTPKELVLQMTTAEKAALVSGYDHWRLKPLERLGIPQIAVSDGPHGLRKQADELGAGNDDSKVTVCFPSGAGMAASFNRELLGEIGETLALEARAEDVSVILGPAANMKRSPLCGRNFEYFSEDPYLAGELAAAYIQGVQSQGVGVSMKHFAVNSQEQRRLSTSAALDERTLREIYLTAFEKAVKQAKPWTLMCAYNKINGEYCSQNKHLLTEILREEWGFDGLVMSDWGAVCERPTGIAAGLDLEMPSSGEENTRKIVDAIGSGKLSKQALDTCCERVVGLILKAQTELESRVKPIFDHAGDHEKARCFARETQVLLKNNGVLPLKKTAHIVFVGEFAEFTRYQGGGSSHVKPYKVNGALDAAVELGVGVRYVKGFSSKSTKYSVDLAVEAIAAARDADVAVIFAGLPEIMESEGLDRKSLDLPKNQNTLIAKIAAVQPNTVVVLQNGSPVTMPWLDDVAAVLESYLGGEAVGNAQAEILFGEVNPSGKLAETFPLCLEDTPCYGNYPGNLLTVEHREGIYIGYRWYDKAKKEVLFPFGFGLSYTTFAYSALSTEWVDDLLAVRFKIKNTGGFAGAETAQVYVAFPENKAFHASQELKGFVKVFLQPGEEQGVEVWLDKRAFRFWNPVLGDWDTESGQYTVRVGASSRDIRLECMIDGVDAGSQKIAYAREQYPSYYSGQIQSVPDAEFGRLLGFQIPRANPLPGERVNIYDTLEIAAVKTQWGRRVADVIRFTRGKFKPVKDAIFNNPQFYVAAALEAPFYWMARGAAHSEELRLNVAEFFNGNQTAKALRAMVKAGFLSIPVIHRLITKSEVEKRRP
ncbi:MAG: glycoside hydrolase family 3 C-terminal domain-containing protein [Oscillospiraceae bacterium]|jgi:beta-glucosidase|nr:glycoside hydrolase family 3 C-terminal domain-containing protein [Oscillospiraceae bacterium]